MRSPRYGIYVDVASYPDCGINYTNGGPEIYGNIHLELTTYCGKGTPAFTGPSLKPLIWNGTIYYQTGPPDPLTLYPDNVVAWLGGAFEFELFGDGLGNRKYALFGTSAGTTPGIPLPGGMTLPINGDWFSEILMILTLSGSPLTYDFLGTLDADGYATAELTVPGHWNLFDDIFIHFAWCTYKPVNFVSNPVQALLIGTSPPPPYYLYDDKTTEKALGLTNGGQTCWMHWFNVGSGPSKIVSVSTAFGSTNYPSPPAGAPAAVYVWEDRNDDGDPSDAVLLAEVETTVQDPGTDLLLEVDVGTVEVSGGFFSAPCAGMPPANIPAPWMNPLDPLMTAMPGSWGAWRTISIPMT